MFKRSLSEKLANIFSLKRVSYDEPGEAKEQEILFIKVDSAYSRVTNGRAISKAMGSISVFANQEKLPFGFFTKKINHAESSDTIDLFFYNFDQNDKYFGNLVERKCNFIYFYNEQYDPDQGSITSVNMSEETP